MNIVSHLLNFLRFSSINATVVLHPVMQLEEQDRKTIAMLSIKQVKEGIITAFKNL